MMALREELSLSVELLPCAMLALTSYGQACGAFGLRLRALVCCCRRHFLYCRGCSSGRRTSLSPTSIAPCGWLMVKSIKTWFDVHNVNLLRNQSEICGVRQGGTKDSNQCETNLNLFQYASNKRGICKLTMSHAQQFSFRINVTPRWDE